MRTPIIAGNWKMHKTIDESLDLVKTLQQKLAIHPKTTKFELIVAPPYTAINRVSEFLTNSSSPIKLSAQNLFWEESGAFTGEISAKMLKDAGATYVIVGHSERRQLFYETDLSINKKIKVALKNSLTPIFCIGETLAEREANQVEVVIKTQLLGGLDGVTNQELNKIVFAYEPVWAIGTGKTASPFQAEMAHSLIRDIIATKFSLEQAHLARILYGGSVKPDNSRELLTKPNIDGALVGGASLKAEDFIGIIASIA